MGMWRTTRFSALLLLTLALIGLLTPTPVHASLPSDLHLPAGSGLTPDYLGLSPESDPIAPDAPVLLFSAALVENHTAPGTPPQIGDHVSVYAVYVFENCIYRVFCNGIACHNNPVNCIDPIGLETYLIYREFNDPELALYYPYAGHFYLAFDNIGVDQNQWRRLLARYGEQKSPQRYPDIHHETFSFHPWNARDSYMPGGDDTYNRVGTLYTEASYIGYNDTFDQQAFRNQQPLWDYLPHGGVRIRMGSRVVAGIPEQTNAPPPPVEPGPRDDWGRRLRGALLWPFTAPAKALARRRRARTRWEVVQLEEEAQVVVSETAQIYALGLTDDRQERQFDMYRRAIASREAINRGPGDTDFGSYMLGVRNCGTWSKFIIDGTPGVEWPRAASRHNLLGCGVDGPIDYTGLPQISTGVIWLGVQGKDAWERSGFEFEGTRIIRRW